MPPRRKRRRIAVVTGTRAEYGLLRTTLRALGDAPEIDLRILAAGMHLLRDCGLTVREISADGWPIACRVPMQRGDGSPADQGLGLGRGIQKIARYLVDDDIDIVVVLGDRIEAMAGALAATTTGRMLAHIHGGDVAEGDFDDALRHSITKLAHLHFVASADARNRVIRLGESPRRVWQVGAPGLDDIAVMLAQRGAARQAAPAGQPSGPRAARCAEGPGPPYAVVIQHPCGRAESVEYAAARATLAAAAAAGLRRCIILPNSDRGRAGVMRAIHDHEHRSSPDDVEIVASFSRDAFLTRLLGARLLLGNSSCGIIEAPFAGVPSVDVGPRQAGRQPGGATVFRAPERESAIQAMIRRALTASPRPGQRTIYGRGGAGRRIAAILRRAAVALPSIKKRIEY
ncbi:MAG: UDP-N-acetyl glucosamine 2-epimerase [Planctomycetota bacterium]